MTIFNFEIFWITIAPSYYWLMYALGFLFWYILILKRWKIPKKDLEDLFLYIFLGVVLWWRLWYVIFYNPQLYLNDMLWILRVWEWWMSFHWGVIWVILSIFIFSKKSKLSFLKIVDQVTLVLPIWLWLWRIWNYLNKELLWYSWYNWLFKINIDWINYFPSPLLEALLEWFLLFIILNFIYYKKWNIKKWQIASLFLFFYWIFRLFVEIFFRRPDEHIGYIFWFLTMWEILSLPMIMIWIFLFITFKKW